MTKVLRTRRSVLVAAAAGVVLTACSRSPGNPVNSGEVGTSAGRRWLSGASGTGVADGSFARWRGSAVDIAGTWSNDLEGQINLWPLQPDAEYGQWPGALDLAVGAIFKSNDESWAQAASGAYDARWRQSLILAQQLRSDAPGTVYLRFAHEFNGDWFDWSVDENDAADFVIAWQRYRAIQRAVAPEFRLVFCPNVETIGSQLDWRQAFPGPGHVDVMAVDSYNQYPYVDTTSAFESATRALDEHGAPRGIESHREYAESLGLPFAIAEWSGNADFGDSAVFITEFRKWLENNAGTEAGQVAYEVQFNVGGHDHGNMQMFPETRQPNASRTYQTLW